MKTRFRFLVIFALFILIFAGCSNEQAGSKEDGGSLKGEYITILTGGSAGVYYVLGGTLAKLYQEELGAVATSQSTAASAENATKLQTGKAEIAFLMGDTAEDAYNGKDSFKDKGAQKNLRTIAALYPNYLQIAVTKKSGIKTIEDLKGKKVAVGAPASGTELSTQRVLEAYGMQYADIRADYLSFSEGVEGMKNGTVDAVVISSGLPNSGLLELATTEEITIVEIEEEKILHMQADYPSFFPTTIPAGTYKGQDEDIKTIGVNNVLMTHKDVSEEVVYELTKALFDHVDKLIDSHKAAEGIDLKKAQENLPSPLHPGAEKFYKEMNE